MPLFKAMTPMRKIKCHYLHTETTAKKNSLFNIKAPTSCLLPCITVSSSTGIGNGSFLANLSLSIFTSRMQTKAINEVTKVPTLVSGNRLQISRNVCGERTRQGKYLCMMEHTGDNLPPRKPVPPVSGSIFCYRSR